MQLVVLAIAVTTLIVAVIGLIFDLDFAIVLSFLAACATVIPYLVAKESKQETETLDQRNRRVILNHVENYWVKGVLEKSLHGAALLELGIKEEPSAINYPWTIKEESTDDILPAGKSMLEIFHEVGMGRSLLILGAPGSGKTTMLLELTRQLIVHARHDDFEPIPVVFNLGSWKENQTLANWLAEQLNSVYYVPKKIALTWVRDNKMLLLLDGLDEVEQVSRTKCIEVVNQFRKEHGMTSLVICSRTVEYADIDDKLSFEGAITLQPLASEQISIYIDSFGNKLASLRLVLKKDNVLQELADTPLMLSIMTLSYKDLNGTELLAISNVESRRKHLFNAYIERMFERSTHHANSSFTKSETLHYLSWLARKMIQHHISTYQIESMQPSWFEKQSQHRPYKFYFGLLFGLLFGLITWLRAGLLEGLSVGLSEGLRAGLLEGLRAGLLQGLIIWLLIGLIFGLLDMWDRIFMVDRLAWSLANPRKILIFALTAWLVSGLGVGLHIGIGRALLYGLVDGLVRGLVDGLVFGLVFGLVGGLVGGLTSEQIEETAYPGQHLRQSLSNALFAGLVFGLVGGLFFSTGDLAGRLAFWLIG
jgi:hypothetical protein